MTDDSRVRLLDVDPELGRYVPSDEVDDARAAVRVPARSFGTGPWDPTLGAGAGAEMWGSLILEGLVLQETTVEDRSSLQLLGPGDLIAARASQRSIPPLTTSWTVASPTRVAVLEQSILVAVHRWPQLVLGLMTRQAEQLERATVDMAVGQLPNVEQRLMAMFWQLADRWGHVSAAGVSVPLALSHEVLGKIVGARRPTVSLALSHLADAGRLVRRADRSWLLTEPPPEGLALDGATAPVVSLLAERSDPVARRGSGDTQYQELSLTVRRLRETLAHERQRLDFNFARYQQVRRDAEEIRRSARRSRGGDEQG